MESRKDDEDLSSLYKKISRKLHWHLRRAELTKTALAREVELATGRKCHLSDICRIFNCERLTQIKKVLPVIIRMHGFSSRAELDEFLKLIENVLSNDQGVRLRMAVLKACDEVNLPDLTPDEPKKPLSDAEKLVRAKHAFQEFEKHLRDIDFP